MKRQHIETWDCLLRPNSALEVVARRIAELVARSCRIDRIEIRDDGCGVAPMSIVEIEYQDDDA